MQRIKAESKTAGGIILPESAVKELNEAKVLAVGPGRVDDKGNRVPMAVATGDHVLIPQVCCRALKKIGSIRRLQWLGGLTWNDSSAATRLKLEKTSTPCSGTMSRFIQCMPILIRTDILRVLAKISQ